MHREPSRPKRAVPEIIGRRQEDELLRLASFPLLNPNPVLELDSSGRIIFHNQAAHDFLLQHGQLDIRAFLPADFTRILEQAGRWQPEALQRDVELAGRVFSESIFFVRQFNTVRIYAVDVTDSRRARAAWQKGEERFRSVLDNSLDVIYRLNLQTGRYEYMSPSCLAVVKFTADELLGMSNEEVLARVHPDDQVALKSALERLNDTGVGRCEYRFRGKDGEYHWCSNHMVIIKDGAGRPLYRDGILRDITENKQAEVTLRQSEERYRILVELSPDAVFVNRDDSIVFINTAGLKLFGASGPEEVLGRSPYELFHPNYHGVMRERIEQLLAGHSMPLIEGTILRVDGGAREVEVTASPFMDPQGPAIQVVLREVTERKKRDMELRQLNRTLNALHDSSLAMMRAQNEFAYLAEICKIVVEDCGYSMVWIGYAEGDEAKTVRPVAHAGFEEGYLESLRLTWADTERGRGPTGTAIRTGKVGRCRNMLTDPEFEPWRSEAIKRGYASSIVFPLLDGSHAFGALNIYSQEPDSFSDDEVRLLSELANDLAYGISAIRLRLTHVEAEETLRRTSDYLENLFNYANAPIICWDADFKITRFNHAFEHLTGYRTEEVIGKDLGILFPAVSKDESLSKIRRTLSGEHWDVVEISILTKDGGVRLALWNSANVYAEDGKTLLATIAQGQDITERKQAEEVLQRDKQTLEKLAEARSRQLIDMYMELERAKRLSDIGVLASTVAHELRNPLAAISMAAANIKTKAAGAPIERQLHTIEKKVGESDQIINNLLFYSRLRPPQCEKMEIHGILEECLDSLQAQLKKKIFIAKDLEPVKAVAISADPLQLKEVFNNLLNNAVDAVSDSEGSIEMHAAEEEQNVRVRIRDNGHGIDKRDLERIFDPFFTTKSKGTGLGLTVCNQIIEMHGGTIEVASLPGKGTTVTVTLPKKIKT